MSCYVLIAFLGVMLIMAYLISGKEILSPFVLTVAMYLLSTVTAALYMKKWEFSLSYFTVLIIVTGVLIFGFGEMFAKSVCDHTGTVEIWKAKIGEEEKRIEIPFIVTVLVIFIMLLFLSKTLHYIYMLSLQGGNTDGYKSMLSFARKMTLVKGYSRSKALNHILVFTQALSFIYGWQFLNNFVNKRTKIIDMISLLPIGIAFIIQAVGTVTRGFAISWLVYFFMLYVLLHAKKEKWKHISPLNIIGLGIITLSLFLLVFVLLGMVASRFNSKSIIDTIAFYIGLSIPSFDEFLKNFNDNIQMVGNETLYGIYAVLNRLGLCAADTSRHLEFVDFNGVSGNVYTSLRRYINDYGYVGMYIIQFYLGCFWGLLYYFMKKYSSILLIILFSILAHSLVMQGIDELFLSNYVSLGTLNLFIYMAISYIALIKAPQYLKGRLVHESKKAP